MSPPWHCREMCRLPNRGPAADLRWWSGNPKPISGDLGLSNALRDDLMNITNITKTMGLGSAWLSHFHQIGVSILEGLAMNISYQLFLWGFWSCPKMELNATDPNAGMNWDWASDFWLLLICWNHRDFSSKSRRMVAYQCHLWTQSNNYPSDLSCFGHWINE